MLRCSGVVAKCARYSGSRDVLVLPSPLLCGSALEALGSDAAFFRTTSCCCRRHLARYLLRCTCGAARTLATPTGECEDTIDHHPPPKLPPLPRVFVDACLHSSSSRVDLLRPLAMTRYFPKSLNHSPPLQPLLPDVSGDVDHRDKLIVVVSTTFVARVVLARPFLSLGGGGRRRCIPYPNATPDARAAERRGSVGVREAASARSRERLGWGGGGESFLLVVAGGGVVLLLVGSPPDDVNSLVFYGYFVLSLLWVIMIVFAFLLIFLLQEWRLHRMAAGICATLHRPLQLSLLYYCTATITHATFLVFVHAWAVSGEITHFCVITWGRKRIHILSPTALVRFASCPIPSYLHDPNPRHTSTTTCLTVNLSLHPSVLYRSCCTPSVLFTYFAP